MSFPTPATGLSALPLGSVPAVVLDTETTGLDTTTARIVQIGAVRLTHGEIAADDPFELLVDPGIPIPPTATEIHHIGDGDVAGVGDFAAAMPRLAAWAGGTLVIGWSIGFDLAILKAEHARHGLAWQAPRSLDARHLVQVLSPNLPEISLETVAAWLKVATGGRHQALGDARMTAAIFLALLPRLRNRGVTTLAQAERACLALASQQEHEARAGWHEVVTAGRIVPASVSEYARIDSFPYRHRVADMMSAPPVTVANDTALEDALALMMQRKVSSVFLPPVSEGGPHGIITERDILRIIDADKAKALRAPVADYAVRPLVTLDKDEFAYRAIASMSARGFRHLGVTVGAGELVGALSARDLLRQRASDAVSLGDSIEAATSPAALGRIWAELTTVVRGLVYEEVDARNIAAVVSRELRALTRRACEIAERELATAGQGEPPVPYAMLVLGSGGRGESLLAMDQDNAIVFAEGDPDGPEDRWFAQLGKRVSDILNEVGVAYCNGGIMAANAEWRMDLDHWRQVVGRWIQRSRPEDILNADIFFDAVPVHGDTELADRLNREALEAAGGSRTFLQLLSINAGKFEPPIGWFGRFKGDGGRIDLKLGGLMPLFATARVLALRYGIAARATPERYLAAQALLDRGAHAIDDLIGAHRVLLDAILRQQLRDLDAGAKLSNRVAPAALASHEREELRWALKRVSSVRDVLGTPLFG